MITRCESVYKNGKRCQNDNGHHGLHVNYHPAGEGESGNFSFNEWNNKGESTPWGRGEKIGKFPCDFDKGEQERKGVMTLAIEDARVNLDKGTVFEIRSKNYPFEGKVDFARVVQTKRERAKGWGIAWYYVSGLPKGFEDRETAKEPLYMCESTDKGEENVLGGYVLLARIKA